MALQRSLFPWFLFCSFSVGVRSDIIGVCSFCQALKVRNTSVTTTMLHFIQLWDRQEPLWCKEWRNVWNANMCYYFWDTVQDFLLPLGGRNLKATGKKVGRFWRAFLSPMGNFSGSIRWDSTDNPLPEGALNLPPPRLSITLEWTIMVRIDHFTWKSATKIADCPEEFPASHLGDKIRGGLVVNWITTHQP